MHNDYDPWNEPEHRHWRARLLMPNERLWSCVEEDAPFGSDEGAEAFTDFVDWREANPSAPMIDCIAWILKGKQAQYDERLLDESLILEESDEAVLGLGYDAWTLDITILATVLGQLVLEGMIDLQVKPFAMVAIKRMCLPVMVEEYPCDPEILQEVARIIEAA